MSKDLNSLINKLEKGGKKAEVGEVRTWGKQDYKKTVNGWVYNSGPHKGKMMGSLRSEKKTNDSKPLAAKPKKEVVTPVEIKDSKVYNDASHLTSDVFTRKDGSKVRVKAPTGKLSKIPFEKKHNTKTNLIGAVAFGKANKVNQEMLNNMLNDADLLLDNLGITLIKPIDFTSQTLKGKNTIAVFNNLKDRYQSNDRIDIKSDKGVGKSFMHEIGHAIDYSMTDKDFAASFFNYALAGREGEANKKDAEKLREILKDSPFFKKRTDKSYLTDPTEIFARAFEVYAYDKAVKLHDAGKLSDDFLESFNPDFLLSEESQITSYNAVLAALPEEKRKKIESLAAQNSQAYAKIKELRNKAMSGKVAKEDETQLLKEFREAKTKNNLLAKEKDKLWTKYVREWRQSVKKQRRPDADQVRTEVSEIMARMLSSNKIKKALRNLDMKLRKGSDSSYYAAVVVINPITGKVLLGKRVEDGIWTSPAGGADLGETPKQCAVRECWEEAQLAIKEGELIELDVKVAPNGKPVHCFVLYTTKDDFSVKGDPDQEVKEWQWFSPNEFPKGITSEKNKNRLETINQALVQYNSMSKSKHEAKEVSWSKKPVSSITKSIYEDLITKLEKSVTSMAHQDGIEINTSEQAVETRAANPEWLERLFRGMSDFDYGDTPRSFEMDKGTLFLSKIDDGMYSGFFRKKTQVEDGVLEDNAKVRIERQTLPSLVNFLEAKEWLRSADSTPNPTPDVMGVMEAKMEEMSDAIESVQEAPKPEESKGDKAIQLLSLLDKLLN